MAIDSYSTIDREHDKFVESPTRPGKPAVEITGNLTATVDTTGLSLETTQQEVLSALGGGVSSSQDTFTATGAGVTVDVSTKPKSKFSLLVKPTGAVTSWTIVVEGSLDNTNFETIFTLSGSATAITKFSGSGYYPSLYFRSHCTAISLGGGTNVIAKVIGVS